MEPLDLSGLPEQPLLLLDTAPIIYCLEDNAEFGPRFQPLFEAHRKGDLRFCRHHHYSCRSAGRPASIQRRSANPPLSRYPGSWQVVDLDTDIAESAARLRASLHLKLPDAVQAATALAINADALVTHDRDFSRLKSLRVIS